MNPHLSLSTRVVLTPRRAGLRAGADNVVEVLVRVQAPAAPEGHASVRPPQALALVIDRSGSMAGRPLAEARHCAEYLISMLRPTDSVSLVQFDHRVQRLWPAVPLADGQSLRLALRAIRAGGNTHLHGGWLEGAQSLEDVPGTGLKRVILLSDGRANEGLTDPAAIAAQCAQWAARGITTSTCGLGDRFNEDLMVAMAQAGGGNPYYGDTADDLMEPFQQELELLANLCLRELRLSVTVPDGADVEVLNALPCDDCGWKLPDLAWGAEAWALLRLQLPAAMVPPAGARLPVLRVSVTALDLDGSPLQFEKTGLALSSMGAGEYGTLADDELVARRQAEVAASAALTGIREAAGRQDWDTVDELLEQARAQFAGHEWVASLLASMTAIADDRLRHKAMKESLYAAARLKSRLTAVHEDPAVTADAVPAYLRRKPAQGKGKGKV